MSLKRILFKKKKNEYYYGLPGSTEPELQSNRIHRERRMLEIETKYAAIGETRRTRAQELKGYGKRQKLTTALLEQAMPVGLGSVATRALFINAQEVIQTHFD